LYERRVGHFVSVVLGSRRDELDPRPGSHAVIEPQIDHDVTSCSAHDLAFWRTDALVLLRRPRSALSGCAKRCRWYRCPGCLEHRRRARSARRRERLYLERNARRIEHRDGESFGPFYDGPKLPSLFEKAGDLSAEVASFVRPRLARPREEDPKTTVATRCVNSITGRARRPQRTPRRFRGLTP
jgi:hypothetical protein